MFDKNTPSDGGAHVTQPHAEQKVYTLKEMATIFSVSLRTIYNWMEEFRFSYVKIGSKTYVTEKQLQEFLTNHQVESLYRKGGVK
jgi:excisionase family DNA binding protein